MSALAPPLPEPVFSQEHFKECQVFILCADLVAYQHAAEVCEHLLTQFDGEMDFGFNCWNVNELGDPFCARSATKIASSADIILLSLREAEIPPVLSRWLATLPHPRAKSVGALALVLGEPVGSALQLQQLSTQLAQLARQLGLDFLPLGPVFKVPTMPFQVAAKSGQSSDPPNCDHWGLNE